MTTIHRGLMNAATQTPTDPAARLRAIQQRIQTRRQVTGQPTPARQPINPRPPSQFSAPSQGMPSTPSGPPIQTPAAASMQAMPQRPQGMPTPPSGINPAVPGVTMPDAGKAPRQRGGIMAATPYEQS